MTGFGAAGDGGHMQTITTDDTLETLNVKLAARRVVVMRLVKRGPIWQALGSRTDTLCPAVAHGRCPAVAARRLADTLAPAPG